MPVCRNPEHFVHKIHNKAYAYIRKVYYYDSGELILLTHGEFKTPS
jgi:hypothetical protein